MIEILDNLAGKFEIPKTEYLRLNETSFKYNRLKKYIDEQVKKEAYINVEKLQSFIRLMDDEKTSEEEKENE